MRTHDLPAAHKTLEGTEFLDKVIDIDQSPIGRTPRSNPATYTGCFTPIREWFRDHQIQSARVATILDGFIQRQRRPLRSLSRRWHD